MMNKDYLQRFQRHMGIMDAAGIERVRHTRIAVAGLGLGGSIFLNLVRLGFEHFHIADPDTYDRTNISRQRMAKETTIHQRKDKCLADEALAINPAVRIETFAEGVKPGNVDRFLNEVHWVVDVVDLFALPDKLMLNQEAHRRSLQVASCASVGFGASVVVFNESSPSFADLSGISLHLPHLENILRFVQFITPEIPPYMHEQLAKAVAGQSHIPFVVPGVEIAAALCATSITQQILGLAPIISAPEGMYFDPLHFKAQRFEASYRARQHDLTLRQAA